MVRQILEVMKGEIRGITIRHIAHRTGLAPSTLVGIMMGMINQGYITGVLSEAGEKAEGNAVRCGCACCTRKTDRESTSSLDRRIYRITPRGVIYLRNWADKEK